MRANLLKIVTAYLHYVLITLLSITLFGCGTDVEFSSREDIEESTGVDPENPDPEEPSPLRGSILLEDGREFTNKRDLKVTLKSPLAEEMYLTQDQECQTGGEWQPFTEQSLYTAPVENSNVVLFVKFRGDGVESDCLSDSVLHDNLEPEITFTKTPAKGTQERAAHFKFKGEDRGSGLAGIECRLNQKGAYFPCPGFLTINQVPEGTSHLEVIARDRAGNQSVPVDYSWLVDRTAPELVLTQTPAKAVNQTKAQFKFMASDKLSGVAEYHCRFDKETSKKCSTDYLIEKLNEGNHQFWVKAKDEVGNWSEETQYDWYVDLTAPTVSITQGPEAYINQTQAKVYFEGSDKARKIVSFHCQLNGKSLSSCVSPNPFTNLTEGAYIFQVTAKDEAGNVSQPAEYRWSVDLTKPNLSFVQTPTEWTNSYEAHFVYRLNDNLSGIDQVDCQLDGASVDCDETMADLKNLTEGPHTLVLSAKDKAGNQADPLDYSWGVDTIVPTVQLTKTPDSQTASSQGDFEFLAEDKDSGVLTSYCRIDSTTSQPCSSPISFNQLQEGNHLFWVSTKDKAGNQSDEESYQWLVDMTPPEIQFVQAPSDHDSSQSALVEVNALDRLSGLKSVYCGLDGALELCELKTVYELSGLLPGTHEFKVVAEDELGHQAEEIHRWTVNSQYQRIEQAVDIEGVNKTADILFVVDNSVSMDYEQRSMAQRLDHFIDKINGLDWQIAVTTTDPRNRARGDGRLLSFPNSRMLISSKLDAATAQSYLGQTVQMRANGSSSEQGIKATYRSLERLIDPAAAPDYKSFLRDRAHFSVVLISDEDESANGRKNRPDELIGFFQSTFPGKNFSFHSIITIPNDRSCRRAEGETYGHRYQEMSQKTGGVIGSVCESDYSSQLAKIGEGVQELVRTVQLQCVPADINGDSKPELDIELESGQPVPKYKVQGMKVVFDTPLPVGVHRFYYYCP